ncbi:MAG: 50S ribosomal protein L25 [Microthrixaceae bacterium]|nr:50S ribosomal protein L25 [Microthrixaceae bacterium]MCO5312515.1 50S ribosomal protein L25 [Microthrixaceae bacterium]HPB44297.1 50S ribosomal protein L25 [Microthrixaceae bacterium]
MAEVTLTATTGRELGTSSSRRLRAEGFIPATVYGMGKDASSVQVARPDFRKAMTTDAGVNALIKLTVDGETEYALVKEIQRHTVRREVIHIDLLRIDPEVPIVLDVPVVLTGEAKQVTAGGGMINQRLRSLRVTVRPDSIPTEITMSITNLDVEQTFTVGDLALPDGVTTELDPTTAVVSAPLTRAAIVAARQAAKGDDAAES